MKTLLLWVLLCGLSLAQVPQNVTEVSKSVVKVKVKFGDKTSTGSGVYIGNDTVLTAKHVINYPGDVLIVTDKGEFKAERFRICETHDQALIRVKVDLPVAIVCQPGPQPRGRAFGVGFAKGETMRVWETHVNELWFRSKDASDPDTIAAELGSTGGSISGCSGGPLVNANGEVIGVVWGNDGTSNLMDGRGRTIATSLPILRRFLNGAR